MTTNRLSLLFPEDSNEEVVLWAIMAAINTKALVDKKRLKPVRCPATDYKVSIHHVWSWAISRPRQYNNLLRLSEFLQALEDLDNLSFINTDFPYEEITVDDNLYDMIAQAWAHQRGARKFHLLTDGTVVSSLHPAAHTIWAKSEADARAICVNRFHRIKRLHDQQISVPV